MSKSSLLSIHEKVYISLASICVLGIVIYLAEVKWNFLHSSKEEFSSTVEKEPIVSIKEEVEEKEEDEDKEVIPYLGYYEGFSAFQHKEGFQEGLSIDDIGKPFKQMENFFKALGKLGERFERFTRSFERFTRSFLEFGEGILMFFKNLGEILRITMTDLISVIGDIAQCGIKYIYNFRECIFFWIIDRILHILKSIFITFPIFLIEMLTGLDLNPLLDDLYTYILVPIDDVIYDITKCHFIHYPDWVISDCYACDIMDDIFQLLFDFGISIPELLLEPVGKILQAAGDFFQMFAPL